MHGYMLQHSRVTVNLQAFDHWAEENQVGFYQLIRSFTPDLENKTSILHIPLFARRQHFEEVNQVLWLYESSRSRYDQETEVGDPIIGHTK